MGLNRCEFIGNLGRDPEIRTTQSGDKVANLSIAVTEKWRDKQSGERKERTTWVPIVIWGSIAKVAEQHLRKGSKVYVAGKFEVRKWQDQSGQDRYSTEVVLQGFGSTLVMLDGPSGQQQPSDGYGSGGGGYGNPASNDVDESEIPF